MVKPESFLQRARRVMATGIDSALEKAERATGPALLKQSIRDLESARDKLVASRRAAEAEAREASVRSVAATKQAASFGKDAAYAMGRGKEDLARKVVAAQLAAEQESESEKLRAKAAQDRAKELEGTIADFDVELSKTRADVEAILAGGQFQSNKVAAQSDSANALVERTRGLMERVAQRPDAASDVDALRREEELEARLDALKKKWRRSRRPSRERKRRPRRNSRGTVCPSSFI